MKGESEVPAYWQTWAIEASLCTSHIQQMCSAQRQIYCVEHIYLSIHPSGSLSGGLSVRPSIHPPQIIHPSHPDSLLCICLLISICIYKSECMSIYVSLPLYLFICPTCLCVCLWGAIGQWGPGSSPFPGCIVLFINVGFKYGNTRTERRHATFPPIGSETTIPMLDPYYHRLLDRMHRKIFTVANEISRE